MKSRKRLCLVMAIIMLVLQAPVATIFAGSEEPVVEVAQPVPVEAPEVSGPVEPASSEPISSEPVLSEPVSSEPVSSEPVSSEPVSSEPVSSEPVSSEPAVSEPAEAAPATILSAELGGTRITLSAPAGSLPEGAYMSVSPVTGGAQVEAAKQCSASDGSAVEGFKAFDITIYNAAGEEIQPLSGVSVTFSNIGIAGDGADVYHVAGGSPESVSSSQSGDAVSFTAGSFSIYIVVITANPGTADYEEQTGSERIKVRFEDTAGNRLEGTPGTLSFGNQASIASLVSGVQIEGYTFENAYFYYYGHYDGDKVNVTSWMRQDVRTSVKPDSAGVGYDSYLLYYGSLEGAPARWYAYNPTGVFHIVYAKTENVENTVTYKANYDSAPKDVIRAYESGRQVSTEAADLFAGPEGKGFVKWTTNADGTGDSYGAESVLTSAIDTDYVLYAQWKDDEYTVTYNGNGGIGSTTDSKLYGAGDIAAAAENGFVRNGYAFVNWNTRSDGRGTSYGPTDTMTVNGDITLYAQWVKNNKAYKVTYYPSYTPNNGNVVKSYTEKQVRNDEVTVLPNSVIGFARPGYRFLGWTTKNNENNNQAVNIAVGATITGKMFGGDDKYQLYAVWADENAAYTVEYYKMGDNGEYPSAPTDTEAKSGKIGDTATAPTGYESKYAPSHRYDTAAANVTSAEITENGAAKIKLYYALNKYTVTYNGNGETSGSTSDAGSYSYNAAATVMANGFAKTDHEFVKWNTKADGSGTSYAPAERITMTANVTLYAIWNQVNAGYTVEYYKMGEDGTYPTLPTSTEAKSGKIGNTATATAGYESKYAPSHKYDAAAANVTSAPITDNGSATLKLYYCFNTYTVTYNANGGAGSTLDNASYRYGSSATAKDNGFTYGHKVFVKWNTSPNNTGISYAEGGNIPNITANVNLYAIWEDDEQFTLTYHYGTGTFDGGDWYSDEDVTVKSFEGAGFTLPADGSKKFLGWADAEGGEVAHAPEDMINLTADKDIYAVLGDEQQFRITYIGNGGSLTGGSTSYTSSPAYKGRKLKVDANSFANSGYKFLGWSTLESATVAMPAYAAGAELTMTADVTLYAVWEKDESQQKTLSYTVEYYKDNVFEESKTTEKTVWVKAETLSVTNLDKSDDRYDGYKFDHTDPTVVPAEIADKGVIKVYYVKDETQQKTLSYTVKYYKDNVHVEGDDKTESKSVWVGDPDTIAVGTINTANNKYEGYKFDHTTPSSIPANTVSGSEIGVYYVKDATQQKEITATVKYYKDSADGKGYVYVTGDDKTITKKIWVLDTKMDVTAADVDMADDKYPGYSYVSTDPSMPAKAADKDVISVYYAKDETKVKELSYTVKYYVDGVYQTGKDVPVTMKNAWEGAPDTLKVTWLDQADNRFPGAYYDSTAPAGLKVNESMVEDGSVISVYYKTKSALTLTANSELNLTYTGLEQTVSGFTSSDSTLAISGVTASGSAENAGLHEDAVSFLDKDALRIEKNGEDVTRKYAVTYIDGDIQIAKAKLTVTVKDETVAYTDPVPAYSLVSPNGITGFVNGEDESVLKGVLEIACAYTRTTPVSASPLPIKASGYSADNYDIEFVDGTLTILSSNGLAIAASGYNGIYDSAAHDGVTDTTVMLDGSETTAIAPVYSLEKNGTYSSEIPELTDAGTYTVYVKVSYENYQDAETEAEVVISKAELTLEAEDKSRVYGAVNPALTYKNSGIQVNDTLADILAELGFDITTTAAETSPAGSYPIQIALAQTETKNYIASTTDGTLTIYNQPAPPSPTPTQPTTPPTAPPTQPTTPPATPTTQPVPSPSTTVIPSEDIPQAGPTQGTEEIEPSDVPLAGTGAWALVNLILTVLTALTSILLLMGIIGERKKSEENEEGEATEYKIKKRFPWRVLSLIPAIGAIIAFILTQDMSLKMVLTDKWTLLMAVIAVIQLVATVFSIKGKKKDDEPDGDAAA